MKKYSEEYNYLLDKSKEKLSKIDIGNYPNNEILVPVQRELKCNYKELEISNTSINNSVIIFKYTRIKLFGGWIWNLIDDNLTNINK